MRAWWGRRWQSPPLGELAAGRGPGQRLRGAWRCAAGSAWGRGVLDRRGPRPREAQEPTGQEALPVRQRESARPRGWQAHEGAGPCSMVTERKGPCGEGRADSEGAGLWRRWASRPSAPHCRTPTLPVVLEQLSLSQAGPGLGGCLQGRGWEVHVGPPSRWGQSRAGLLSPHRVKPASRVLGLHLEVPRHSRVCGHTQTHTRMQRAQCTHRHMYT